MTTMPTDWDNDAVKRYLTAESHQKSKEEFERTHIDIDKIQAEYLFPHATTEDFVTQEEFRDAILKSSVMDDNRIFILRGETGSGKSQLCQWLEYQIGRERDLGVDETHIALHVSRSQTQISDIVDILTEPIDIEIQVGNVDQLDPEKVASAMVANLEAYAPTTFEMLTSEEVSKLVQKRQNGTDLEEILEENIREYQEAVESEGENDIPNLISEKNYRNLSLAAFNEARGGETIFPALRGFLHDELSSKLNVGDFQEKLETISDAYVEEGLRPVLICEDLTTFSVLKEQLLDHIFQLDSGHYDVVLGWTTGWEKDDLNKALGTNEDTYTYMKDRAEGYLSTTDDSGQAYFLTEDVTVELARKYLSVIREDSDVDPGVEIPYDDFDELYPFNAEFIRQSYENLVQDGNERRTPRLLLIRIIKESLNATAPPFESIDGNPYVKQFPTPVSLEYSTTIQSLAKWYGIPTAENNIRIPRGIFGTFDVSIPTSSLSETESEVVLPGEGGGIKQTTFNLKQVGGTIKPGGEVTVETTLNARPEADVEIELDDDHVGFTEDDGTVGVELPNEEREVTIVAKKAQLSDVISFTVGTDSLQLNAEPSPPTQGEDVTVTARVNGELTEGVRIYRDGDLVGVSNEDGTVIVTDAEAPQLTINGEFEELENELTIPVVDDSIYPVDTELTDDEVEQRLHEYQQWLTNGEKYASSGTLREGAANVLDLWYDSTRLANPNASTTGTAGIYYTRGTETPVSIQSVDERAGISIELPFGTDHDPIYKPLLWSGISSDSDLPREDRYELNYDLLRGWADDEVADFRARMRADIEDCLPNDWTIEEFIIVAKYLLHNVGQGTTDLSRNLVFEKYSASTSYDHPLQKRFSTTDTFRDAYGNLTRSSGAPHELAEGFFKLKKNFVDNERFSEAYEQVAADPSSYVSEAMYIDPGELPTAYNIGTTRSSASTGLKPLFKRVKEYAQEVNSLGSSDVDYITRAVERVDKWYDASHNVPDLKELYNRLYDSVGSLDITAESQWAEQKKVLENNDGIHLALFKKDIESFREVDTKSGAELVSLMHQFEQSRDERVEWDIYEALDEMIQAAAIVDVPERGNKLEVEIRNSDKMTAVMESCSTIAASIGGDH